MSLSLILAEKIEIYFVKNGEAPGDWININSDISVLLRSN
jgi:hypothetical protein